MNSKEYNKMVADARRSVSRKYGFRQSSYINFKVEGGYYFCLYFHTDEAKLTVKPMYADDLWWNIWDASENKMEPLSFAWNRRLFSVGASFGFIWNPQNNQLGWA